jgi:catalase
MKPDEKARLISNIVGHMSSVPERIQRLQISHFMKADPAYGRGVAEGLGKVKEEELVNAK